MTAQLQLGGGESPDFTTEEAREHEVFYTPSLVVRQGLEVLDAVYGFNAPDVLDPSAGTGVFGVEARLRWSEATIIGVEPRDELLPDAYDHKVRATFEAFAAEHASPKFDVIATNPPFSLTTDFVTLARSPELLCRAGIVALLLPVDWWQRSESLCAWVTTVVKRGDGWSYAPNLWQQVYTVGGPVYYRGPGTSADFRNYAWFVWTAAPVLLAPTQELSWRSTPLPWLPGAARKWVLPPGRE